MDFDKEASISPDQQGRYEILRGIKTTPNSANAALSTLFSEPPIPVREPVGTLLVASFSLENNC